GRIVILNPSAGEIPIRAWPLENYVELARRLLENPNRIVVLMGAGADRETTGQLAEKLSDPRCLDLTGETTFEELMDLFCVSEALITNDSGPAHFATLTGIKNFVFLGDSPPPKGVFPPPPPPVILTYCIHMAISSCNIYDCPYTYPKQPVWLVAAMLRALPRGNHRFSFLAQ
ncbi:MAG: glycosyltransferase family 9 protein, partial [Deltaproteobacteria bacterium]